MTLFTRPTVTNDAGDRASGTVLDHDFFYDGVFDAIDDLLHDSSNPTISPADIIAEVVDARGSMPSVDARLDVSLNEDGTPRTSAFTALFPLSADVRTLAARNLLLNPEFIIWPDGDAAAPSYWTLSAGSIARTGTAWNEAGALGDTKRKVGRFSAKVTRAGGTDSYLDFQVLDSAVWSVADHFEGRKFSFGAWVWCAAANRASLILQADGAGILVQRSQYVDGVAGSFHPGDSDWHFLSGTYNIPGSASELKLRLAVESSNGAAYFAGPTLFLGNLDARNYILPSARLASYMMGIPGDLAASGTTILHQVEFARPFLLLSAKANVLTAPVGSLARFNLKTGDGTTFNEVFSGVSARPTIADGAKRGDLAEADGTYQYRCLRGDAGAAGAAGSYLNLYCTAVGSGTPGSDALIRVTGIQYDDPLAPFKDHDDF